MLPSWLGFLESKRYARYVYSPDLSKYPSLLSVLQIYSNLMINSKHRPIAGRVITSPDDFTFPPDTESTHALTGVDKLHAQGISGRGIKIGIIDSGIDYTHPALGSGFGPGHKVVGGFDFVGDNYKGGASYGNLTYSDQLPSTSNYFRQQYSRS
ncbi:hypothetical protein E1B28_000319 [Marasmius oreades]|uniref:Peptidase S8/S53 domain-containing protein n=1 Tax=Marasmius oreades TaxID=181124 RepID=A0A9P7V103_9AGAR|nr:uncharacterized protein E1B28_000319 [Marasmius oreades]KAG7098361.1 hypothetical protein E1B28_000319 [Marasmius oreades]